MQLAGVHHVTPAVVADGTVYVPGGDAAVIFAVSPPQQASASVRRRAAGRSCTDAAGVVRRSDVASLPPLPAPLLQRDGSAAPPTTSTINCAPFGVRRVTAVVHEPASDCLVLGSSFMSDPLAMLVSRSAGVLWRYRPAGDRGAVRRPCQRHCRLCHHDATPPPSSSPSPSPDVLYRRRRAHRRRPLPRGRCAARHPPARRRARHGAHVAALPALGRRRRGGEGGRWGGQTG